MVGRGFAVMVALLLLTDSNSPAMAEVALSGSLTATKSCPAFQSFRKSTNPGAIMIEPGKSYPVIAKNADQASHIRVRIGGATPEERWVAIDCGTLSGNAAAAVSGASASSNAAAPAMPAKISAGSGAGFQTVLSLSWQAAFCEGHPDKAECGNQTPDRYDATHLTLHGLWPQPRRTAFCGVDGRLRQADENHDWQGLPEPEISAATLAHLQQDMPGTQSLLERHEWIKHGTCYDHASADTYFSEAMLLADAVNGSPVQALLASRRGQEVTMVEIKAAFDQAFGPGAGDRVRMACVDDGSRRLVSELTIGLNGRPSAGHGIAELMLAGRPTDPGCPKGIVDPVGLQ